MCSGAMPIFAEPSTSVVAQRWNSSPCSGLPASPTTIARSRLGRGRRREREHEENRGNALIVVRAFLASGLVWLSAQLLTPTFCLLSTPAPPRGGSPTPPTMRPTSTSRTIGMCHSSRSSTVVTPRPVYRRSSGEPADGLRRVEPAACLARRSAGAGRRASSRRSTRASPGAARTCAAPVPSDLPSREASTAPCTCPGRGA